MRHVVARAGEIAPGERKLVTVGGRSIAIFNVGGEFLALRNRCPHQGAPLCAGELFGVLESTQPGEYVHRRPGEMVRCPWHGWEFDLRTGRSWFDPERTRVRSYPVTVRRGGIVEGPYRAETYPVTREHGDELVIEL